MVVLKIDDGIIFNKIQGDAEAPFAFYKIIKSGDNAVSQNTDEIYEIINSETKLGESDIKKFQKKHGCVAQKDKLNIRNPFMPFIEFKKESALKNIDIFKLIKKTSPLKPK